MNHLHIHFILKVRVMIAHNLFASLDSDSDDTDSDSTDSWDSSSSSEDESSSSDDSDADGLPREIVIQSIRELEELRGKCYGAPRIRHFKSRGWLFDISGTQAEKFFQSNFRMSKQTMPY
jgi:hypothetical protein